MALLFMLIGSLPVTAQDDTEPTATASTPYRIDMRDHGTAMAVEWSPESEILAISGTQGVWLYDNNFQEVNHLEGIDRHTITSISWRHDGSMVAGTAFDLSQNPQEVQDVLLVWEVETGQVITRIETGLYTPVIWQPNGNLLAIGNYPGELRVYDALTGARELLFRSEETEAFPNSAAAVCWSPDGETIVAAFNADTYILDIDSTEVIRHFAGGGGSRECSPDGTMLADIFSFVRDLESGEDYDLEGDYAEGYAASWSPDGERLAINSGDQRVRVWNVSTGKLVAELEGGMRRASGTVAYFHDSIDWSPDGNMLAAASEDGLVRVWATVTYQLISILEFEPISLDSQ